MTNEEPYIQVGKCAGPSTLGTITDHIFGFVWYAEAYDPNYVRDTVSFGWTRNQAIRRALRKYQRERSDAFSEHIPMRDLT